MYGAIGRLLRINLTENKTSVEELPEEDVRKYLGGLGLGSKILFEELKPGINPLGPENKLLFITGPVTGTPYPGNSRYCVLAKSPLTGILGAATAGGWFPAEIKFAGFDGIIFEGSAEKPVYAWVHDGEAETRSAEHLWGKTTLETEDQVKREVGEKKACIAAIGIGGENLVKFACIINDRKKAAGRTGMGAVMGSKRLKAVAVYGKDKIVNVYDKKRLIEHTRRVSEKLLPEVKGLTTHGSASGVLPLNAMETLPTKNFQMGTFDRAEDISGETMSQTILKNNETCFACPVKCIRNTEVKEGRYKGDFGDGPEYETIAAFGSLCLNNDLSSIAYVNHLCNIYSLDTISVGNIIAFTMECWERRLITKEDTDGIELVWGNHQAMTQIIHKIAKREGFGNILAEGVKKAAERIGKGSKDFAIEVKGLEIPMHEPRGKKGLGLAYAISNRGGCHLASASDENFSGSNTLPELGLIHPLNRFSIERKANMIKKTMDLTALMNSMVVCRRTSYPAYRSVTVTDLVTLINLVTGWEMGIREFMTIGERIINLGRAFNVREGITRKNDALPKRFTELLIGSSGDNIGQKISEEDLNKMLEEFYALQGWEKKAGVPTKEKLQELGLKFVAKELKDLGYQ